MTIGVLRRPGLLVSVRSAAEAVTAVEGGADLIDVKEPARGPLGAADSDVIEAVIETLGGRVPVSAALGEWREWDHRRVPDGVNYVKWGLAAATDPDEALLAMCRSNMVASRVVVAYADADRAGSPSPEWLVDRAVRYGFRTFLLDTAVKDGSTLLDWVAPGTLARIRYRLAEGDVRVAVAGSLDVASIRRLASLCPDWFAVRGAACVGGRGGTICADRVRRLKAVIAEPVPAGAG
jgi:uncharacterized protein (UPF0264 family)